MNVGISVSRVGGAAQIKAMKKVAGGLRLDLAAFRELEAFAQLGTDLDAATQSRLDRGYRMVEILKQGQYEPLDVIDQVLIIYAGTRGYLDKVPVNEVPQWEKQFLTFMRDQKPEIRQKIEETQGSGRRHDEGHSRPRSASSRSNMPARREHACHAHACSGLQACRRDGRSLSTEVNTADERQSLRRAGSRTNEEYLTLTPTTSRTGPCCATCRR